MSALSLDFGAKDRAARAYRNLLRAVDDAVSALGLSVAAGACGVTGPKLRDAIDGRGGCRLSTELAAIIADRVGAGSYRDAILDAIRELFGLYQPLSDREYIHMLEGGLLSFGEPGGSKLADLRRKARR